jgi:type II secretory pathway predicted ATPase ExeA
MLTEVMEHFGLRQELHAAGFYETEHHRQTIKDIRATVGGGRLIAVTGIVGSGKTMLLRRLQAELDREGKVLVSKSLSVDKDRATCRRSSRRCSTTCRRTRSRGYPRRVSGANAICRSCSAAAVSLSRCCRRSP